MNKIKRILVTRATSKVGQWFIRRLLESASFNAITVRALCHQRSLPAQDRHG